VQDTRYKIERERDNLKRKGKNLGAFPKKKEGTNPKVTFCVTVLDFLLFWRLYCMDPYNPYNLYNRGKGHCF
jgi:hypothetical protein